MHWTANGDEVNVIHFAALSCCTPSLWASHSSGFNRNTAPLLGSFPGNSVMVWFMTLFGGNPGDNLSIKIFLYLQITGKRREGRDTRESVKLTLLNCPWTGSSTLPLVPTSTAQPQVLNPEANLTEAESGAQEPLRQETPSLPDSVIWPTSGAGPLREGLRWTVSRQARAALGGIFVPARRVRHAVSRGRMSALWKRIRHI